MGGAKLAPGDRNKDLTSFVSDEQAREQNYNIYART
jgi:hypothetical protein